MTRSKPTKKLRLFFLRQKTRFVCLFEIHVNFIVFLKKCLEIEMMVIPFSSVVVFFLVFEINFDFVGDFALKFTIKHDTATSN